MQEWGDIDRRSQMRVANILTCLDWEKLGQKQHQGKRQVVWKKATPPPSVEEIINEQTQSQQGISTPSIPTTPNPNNISDSVKAKVKQEEKKLEVKSEKGIAKPQSQSGQHIQASTPINWLSYPYQSRDVYTLENRANKVKDRVLGCGTNNELISLHAEGKVTEVEIDWLKANLLSDSELTQLTVIEGTKQGNLFNQEPEPKVIDWEDIKEEIDCNMQRLGWSEKRGKEYLIKRYSKSSRLHLTDGELIEFSNFLKSK
ncbi:MAG: hypothetical protein QNJ18_08800 [Xenococcaceae cyanobacterium MO_167.B52]|nr:hypothetical protein [Xenococcaceae cyanobacterium MO_167.B52]